MAGPTVKDVCGQLMLCVYKEEDDRDRCSKLRLSAREIIAFFGSRRGHHDEQGSNSTVQAVVVRTTLQ